MCVYVCASVCPSVCVNVEPGDALQLLLLDSAWACYCTDPMTKTHRHSSLLLLHFAATSVLTASNTTLSGVEGNCSTIVVSAL